MSTRANIKIKDHYNELWFYRHSDGYPEGTMPTLEKFLQWVKDGKIRDNVGQASGWLVLIGAMEYNEVYSENRLKTMEELFKPVNWKVGAYEPTTGQHGDIDFLYTIDLVKKTITTKKI